MREIVLDTETTGMDPYTGDRMVEIGAVEIHNTLPTGKTYHQYINPERDMPVEAFEVHGLSEEFLSDYPVFGEIAQGFLDFIGTDSRLVIHNAEFDMKFINCQLSELGFPEVPNSRVIDTLAMARRKFPGSPANLDALCRRFGIDNSNRTLHGALLDSELLAEVYLELQGGRQHGLVLQAESGAAGDGDDSGKPKRVQRQARPHAPLAEELAAHAALLAELKDPIWAQENE